jgi:hypothetical protein
VVAERTDARVQHGQRFAEFLGEMIFDEVRAVRRAGLGTLPVFAGGETMAAVVARVLMLAINPTD